MQPAIRVENLSKRYRLGATRVDNNLTENLKAGFGRAWRGLTGLKRRERERPESSEFWALKDVSFEVNPGEVVGIIGRNGAGKSTLLKVLSRIVEPTGGRAVVRGRMGSLLEVGTGFHPELTGRENVYLNGSILGMSQKEISRKFDEIVAFSGVEKFLDTPVKRYSSGMYVRLAFAVAAHLEPEILVVDEVLAVGDAMFQQRCLRKMREVAAEGRTVLFVSHNMGAIQAFCNEGVLLQSGRVSEVGPIERVVRNYLFAIERQAERKLAERQDRSGSGEVRLESVEVFGPEEGCPATGHPAYVRFKVSKVVPGLACLFTVYDVNGIAIAHFSSQTTSGDDGKTSRPEFGCMMDGLLLVPGQYRVNVSLHAGARLIDHVEGATVFTVEGGAVGTRPVNGAGYGSVHLPHRWEIPS